MFECEFCKKVLKNRNSLAQHKVRCPKNPNGKPSPFKKYNEDGQPGRIGGWNKGLTKETDERLANAGKKIQAYALEHGSSFKGKTHSEKTKKKLSESRKRLYESGWEPVCGRAKKYDYESPIAGKIKVDGTWELEAAKYFDLLGVKWERNRKRFKYINLEGKESTYQPDFFVYDWNRYVEVKGYETDLDKCKWEQFNFELEIWKSQKISEIRKINQQGAETAC